MNAEQIKTKYGYEVSMNVKRFLKKATTRKNRQMAKQMEIAGFRTPKFNGFP